MVRQAEGGNGPGREGYPSREFPWDDVIECIPGVVALRPSGLFLERTLRVVRRATITDEMN